MLKGHPPFFLRLASSDRPIFLALSQKKAGEKERKKKRQGFMTGFAHQKKLCKLG